MKSFPAAVVTILLLASCTTATPKVTIPAVPEAVSPAAGIVAAGRLAPEDVARVHAAGIRHVIDLTLDAETPGFDEASAMRASGIAYSNLPVRGPEDLTAENVRAFDALLGEAPRPVLVHCASGNRVGAMAALRAGWIKGRSLEDAVEIGRAWGLQGLEEKVRALLEHQTAP